MSRSNSSVSTTLLGLLGLGVSRIASSLLALAATTIIARNLLPSEVGVFAIVVASCAYLSIAGECGMRSVAMSEGARRGGIALVLRPYLTARLLLSLAVLGLALVVALVWFSSYSEVAVPVLFCCMVMPLQADWILLMNGNFHRAGWATASRPVFYCALIAALSSLEILTLPVLAVLFTVSWALAALFSWYLVLRQGIVLKPESSDQVVSKAALLSLGWPVLGGALITQLMLSADLLWIGATIGKSSAGIYYLASAVLTAGLILANSQGQIALSRYGALRNNPEAFTVQVRSDFKLMSSVSAVLALGTIFVLPGLIPRVLGSSYQGTADLIVFLAPYLVIYHIYSLCSALCICLGLQKKALRGLSSVLIVIPITLIAASQAHNLVAFAYAKGFLFAWATAVLLLVIPSEFRVGIWRQLAIPFGVAILILLGLAPQYEHFELGI